MVSSGEIAGQLQASGPKAHVWKSWSPMQQVHFSSKSEQDVLNHEMPPSLWPSPETGQTRSSWIDWGCTGADCLMQLL